MNAEQARKLTELFEKPYIKHLTNYEKGNIHKLLWIKLRLQAPLEYTALVNRYHGETREILEYAVDENTGLAELGDLGQVCVTLKVQIENACQDTYENLLDELFDYTTNFVNTFRAGLIQFEKKLTEANVKRAEVETWRKVLFSTLGVALSAFGLSPLVGIFSGWIEKVTQTQGQNSFGTNYITTEFVDNTGNKRSVLTNEMHNKIGGSNHSEALKALWTQGTADVIKATSSSVIDQVKDSFLEALSGTQKPIPSNMSSEFEINKFVERLRSSMNEMRKAAKAFYRTKLERFKEPEFVGPLVVRYLMALHKEDRLRSSHLSNVVLTMSPFSATVAQDIKHGLKEIFSSLPTQVNQRTIEIIILARYLATNFNNFIEHVKVDQTALSFRKAAFKPTKYTDEINWNEAKVELGETLREYLISLGVAQKRNYVVLADNKKNRDLRAEEKMTMLGALKDNNAVVMLGKSKSQKQDMADVVLWATNYDWLRALREAMGIDRLEESRKQTAAQRHGVQSSRISRSH